MGCGVRVRVRVISVTPPLRRACTVAMGTHSRL